MGGSLAREFLLQFRDYIYREFGIQHHDQKMDVLEMKLRKAFDSRGLNHDLFFQSLVSGDQDTRDCLLEAITVGHTFFYREQAHLNLLMQDIRERKVVNPLIWCAASSSGEEPYSIAIFLREAGIERFTLIASDINRTSLETMNRGSYPSGKFDYAPKHIRNLYFSRTGISEWRILPDIRRQIRIKRLNLQDDLLFEQSFDYIFCRNVMIYFDDSSRKRVIATLARNLKKQGLLFVGHTEAILDMQSDLKKHAPAVFRKV